MQARRPILVMALAAICGLSPALIESVDCIVVNGVAITEGDVITNGYLQVDQPEQAPIVAMQFAVRAAEDFAAIDTEKESRSAGVVALAKSRQFKVRLARVANPAVGLEREQSERGCRHAGIRGRRVRPNF